MKTAQQMLELYIEAEAAVLGGKEFWLNGRKLAREDLSQIRQGRQEWERKVNAEKRVQAGKSTVTIATWN